MEGRPFLSKAADVATIVQVLAVIIAGLAWYDDVEQSRKADIAAAEAIEHQRALQTFTLVESRLQSLRTIVHQFHAVAAKQTRLSPDAEVLGRRAISQFEVWQHCADLGGCTSSVVDRLVCPEAKIFAIKGAALLEFDEGYAQRLVCRCHDNSLQQCAPFYQ